jgi:steroid delta-isomerase-like uncharacterized protein
VTATATTSRADAATAIVSAFFDAYRARDVEAMVDLCTDNADFDYIPFEVVGKQRTVRGKGKIRGVGKAIWVSLIDAFPDLTNEVSSMAADDDGNVAVEVHIGGKQAKSFGALPQTGDSYWLPHLFVFHVDDDCLIDATRAYWDNANWYGQMSWKEVG